MTQRVRTPLLSLTLVYTFYERVRWKIRNFLAALLVRCGDAVT